MTAADVSGPVTEKDIATAIATIEDSRRTHVEWRRYLEAEQPDCDHESCQAAWAERIRIAGDYDHHQRAIDGYDQVLTVLRALGGGHHE